MILWTVRILALEESVNRALLAVGDGCDCDPDVNFYCQNCAIYTALANVKDLINIAKGETDGD